MGYKKNEVFHFLTITATATLSRYGLLQQNNNVKTRSTSSIQIICLYISCYLGLPFISVTKQLFLVIQELFMSFSRIFKIRRFHNRINRTRFLTISAEDALCHVYVIAYGSPGSISPRFRLYGDCLGWTG